MSEPDDVVRALSEELDASELAEWRTFVARCRELARSDAESRETSAMSARVLARTTREDLSWRGDWRLLSGFVRDRFAQSKLLRFAAASLVAHLIALPVVAWVMLRSRAPEPHFWTGIEPPLADALPLAPIEPEPELELEPADVWSDVRYLETRRAVEDALRLDRYFLQSGGLPRVVGGADRPDPVARLLALRSAAGSQREPLPAASDDLARVIWAEFELDRFVRRSQDRSVSPHEASSELSGELLGELQRLAQRLSVEDTAPGADGLSEPIARLARRTLTRAQAYGIAIVRRAPSGGSGRPEESARDDPRAASLARAGFERAALAAACAARGIGEDPAVRAWIEP